MSLPAYGDPALLEELQRNHTAGPRPISVEEYQARQAKFRSAPKATSTSDASSGHPPLKKNKSRAGRAVKRRKEIANLYRLANLSVTKEEKRKFLNQIRTIRDNNQHRSWAGSESKKTS